MKRMKKLTTLLLVLTMCIIGFVLTGCGDSETANQNDEPKETAVSKETSNADGPSKSEVDKIDFSAEWEYDFPYDDQEEGYSRNCKVTGKERLQYVDSKLFTGKLSEDAEQDSNMLVIHMHEEISQNILDADGNPVRGNDIIDPDLLANLECGNALDGVPQLVQKTKHKDTGETVRLSPELQSDLLLVDTHYGIGSEILDWIRSKGCDVNDGTTLQDKGSFYSAEGENWVINRHKDQWYDFCEKETVELESFYLFELSRPDVPVTVTFEESRPGLMMHAENPTLTPEEGTKQTMIIELPQ